MDKTKLKEFLKIDEEYKAIGEKRDAIRAEILADFQKNKINKLDTDYGTFTVQGKTTYKYSATVDKLSDKLKLAKVKEEQNGTAKASVTEFIRFTAATNDSK